MALYDPKIVAVSANDSYWAAQGLVAGTVYTSQADPTQVGCAICTLHVSRTTPSATREDLTAFSFAFAKNAGSNRNTPTVAELSTIEPLLDTFWANVRPSVSTQFTLADFTWHFRNAAAARDGPAVRVVAKSSAGASSTGRLPDQDAMTLTLVTPGRKHWGRVYLPGLSLAGVDSTYGRWTNTVCDSVAAAGDTLATSTLAAGFSLGVWSKRGLGFLDLYAVHVDNVVDIQRRRRAKQRSYIKTYGH